MILKSDGILVSEATGDATVHAGPCTLYSVSVTLVGVTADDKVEILDDTTVIKTFVAHGTDEDQQWLTGTFGVRIADSLKVDVTLSGGAAYITSVYHA